MGAILLASAAAALAVYGLVAGLPRLSPRHFLVGRLGPRRVSPELSPAQARLAGRLQKVPMTRNVAPGRFRAMQAALACGALVLAGHPWLLFGLRPDWAGLLFYPALMWAAPEVWLWLQLRRRRALLARTYPDLLSHLVTQTRAGAGTLQAFASVPPVLREPLRTEVEDLIADLRISPFPAALQRFADRCEIPEIRAFAQNVIYQQSLGIALPDVLAAEEAHTLAMARQNVRQRIQGAAIAMAAVTVILLLNGLAMYLMPLVYDLSRLMAGDSGPW